MEKKNVTIYYGLIVAIYSVGFVTMSAFSSVYLLDAGLSNRAVGILLAIGALAAVAFQPLTGALIDRHPKITTKKALLFFSSLVVVFGIVIILIPNKSIALTSVLYGITIFLLMLAQPFINSIGMDAVNFGYPINFGAGRSLGSFGYAAGSYVFGLISVAFGPKSIPIAFSLAFFVLSILVYIYPVKTPKDVAKISHEKRENPFLFLGRYKRLLILLIGLILIYFSHSLLNTYALQIVTPKGGNSGDMGTASAIAAGCELITAFLFSFYMRKVKLHILLKISGIFFTLKIFFSYVVTTVTGFFLIQGFQMFGWGLISVGIIYYVNDLVKEHDKAQGQAYAGMAFTVASVVANFLGGNLIDAFGVDTMLIIGTISSLVGTVILWVTATEITK